MAASYHSHAVAIATMTESTCRADTARGIHMFRVADYSLLRRKGGGHFTRSSTFSVGGLDWCVRFYPDGDLPAANNGGCIAFCLELLSGNTQARASVEFRLVDVINGHRLYFRDEEPMVYDTTDNNDAAVVEPARGFMQIMAKPEFEASPYLRNDGVVIECSLIVIKGHQLVEDELALPAFFNAQQAHQVTPSDLSSNLGKLLEGNKGTDVTFKVKDELFSAHKVLLASRSPVFDAQLFGTLTDATGQCITVEDMQPVVFKALLNFIYAGALPAMDVGDATENYEIVKHLLVAADRYGMENLKLSCENILCMFLTDVEQVATTLALADQHNCFNLKAACINLIASSNRTNDVVASQGYLYLKRACPTLLVEAWEKVAKHRQNKDAHP